MADIRGNTSEIRELARYEVRPESLERCLSAIHEFVAYVRSNEPGALRYEVWQEAEHPTRFVHLFIWRDAEANRIHGESAAARRLREDGVVFREEVADTPWGTREFWIVDNQGHVLCFGQGGRILDPPVPLGVKRILVIGPGGSGKTTVARRLAQRTGLPPIHLDALFWPPCRRQLPQ